MVTALSNKSLLGFLCISILFPIPVFAVGGAAISNQVVGAKAFGMGNAFVATADDPSAVYFNPAGLTQLTGKNFSIGLTALVPNTTYDAPDGTRDKMESYTALVPNLYFTAPLGKMTFGVGLNSPYGLETHWRDDGPLRYVATDSNLSFVQVNPVLGIPVNEKLSVGFGVAAARVSAQLVSKLNVSGINTQLNSSPTASPDGNKKLEGDGIGWGYNAGLLYQPGKQHAIGVSYRSEIKATLEGQTELSGLSGTAAALFGGDTYRVNDEAELDFPQTLILGYAYKPGQWTFEIDGEWADYSTVDETRINFKGESDPTRTALLNTGNPIPRDWHNTWNLGIGCNYIVNETWQARAGFFHYPRVTPNHTWDPSLPESSHDGYTIGGTFSRRWFSMDFMYNYILFDNRTINNSVGAESGSTVNGEYATSAHIVATNFNFHF